MSTPTPEIDRRFSDPAADPTPWSEAERVLRDAGLYWITTVRADGRPHVTPLVAVWHHGAMHFCTGEREQKARNLEHHADVAFTTGRNTWDDGLDVVVEGRATRLTETAELRGIAAAYVAKYGDAWSFRVGDGAFDDPENGPVLVYRVPASKVLAFAKAPHAQTRFRFTT